MSNKHSERLENRERLGEIVEVLRRNEITKGIFHGFFLCTNSRK